jgi:Cof subfamily protein (haloacid dehalogenase superfamily)
MLTAYYASGTFLFCFISQVYPASSTKLAFATPASVLQRRKALPFQLQLTDKSAPESDDFDSYEYDSIESLNGFSDLNGFLEEKNIENSLASEALPLTIIDTPSVGKLNQPSKMDLYSSEELLSLLNIHNNLSDALPEFYSPSRSRQGLNQETDIASSLQDLIVQTVQEIDAVDEDEGLPYDVQQRRTTLKFKSHYELSDFKRILPKIRAIASDVDGTLLSSDHSLHPLTKQAIKNAVEAAFSPMHPLQYFFPATGKTRAGALGSLGPEMQALLQQVPGVYVQGLYCVDAAGNVVFEKKLSRIAVEEAEALAKRCGVSLVAYDGDSLYVTSSSHTRHVEEISTRWGEPSPIRLEGAIVEYLPCFHKILLMGDDPEQLTKVIRPQLEALAVSLDCVVTQAIPTMLELLPAGCSKAVGVQKLCEALGLNLATDVCAIGDAENDLDMLRLAAIGVAVGNAAPSVKDIAPVVLEETNDEGGAGRAIELFGLGKAIELMEQQ